MTKNLLIAFSLFGMLLASCAKKEIKNNELSEQEKDNGYILLFDGQTTTGWHVYNQGKVNSAWMVSNGELYCDAGNANLAHGDLVSDDEYENFELTFEWKIAEKGNSGVFINVKEHEDIPTAWATGPEYQLLDRAHHDYNVEVKRPGCLYGFGAQRNKVEANPSGEWNQSRIKQVDGKIEFYLNGTLTAQQDLHSPEWRNMISQTNFKNFPEFGKQTKGRIALQEWEKGVSFRNIKVKKL